MWRGLGALTFELHLIAVLHLVNSGYWGEANLQQLADMFTWRNSTHQSLVHCSHVSAGAHIHDMHIHWPYELLCMPHGMITWLEFCSAFAERRCKVCRQHGIVKNSIVDSLRLHPDTATTPLQTRYRVVQTWLPAAHQQGLPLHLEAA